MGSYLKVNWKKGVSQKDLESLKIKSWIYRFCAHSVPGMMVVNSNKRQKFLPSFNLCPDLSTSAVSSMLKYSSQEGHVMMLRQISCGLMSDCVQLIS